MPNELHPFELPMVVLDIETLGLRQNSTVWEIGAILIEGYPSLQVLAKRSWYLHMKDQEGRFLDPQTVAWTAQVGGDFRRMHAFIAATEEGVSVERWLDEYTLWVEHNWLRLVTPGGIHSEVKMDPCTWTYGTHFDITLLDNLAQEKGLKAPWKYDKPMDLRTIDRLYTLFGGDDEKNPDEVPHDALGDCRLQLRRLQWCFKLLAHAGFERAAEILRKEKEIQANCCGGVLEKVAETLEDRFHLYASPPK